MVSNNQISLQNVLRRAEKDYFLIDWGNAACMEKVTIYGRNFSKKYNPLCR